MSRRRFPGRRVCHTEMTEPLRITVLTRMSNDVNAIHDASACLVDALNRRGHEAKLIDWAHGVTRSAASGSDLLVVPYNPFLYGRWGFAPSLIRDVARIKRSPIAAANCSRRPRDVRGHSRRQVAAHRGMAALPAGRAPRARRLLVCLDRGVGREAQPHPPDGPSPARDRPCRTRAPSGMTSARSSASSDRFVVATLATGHPVPSHLVRSGIATAHRGSGGRPTTFLQLGARANPVEGIPPRCP